MTSARAVHFVADLADAHARLERATNRRQGRAGGGGVGQGPVPTSRNNGGTDFYDAVYLAAHDKLADEAGRKAMIILTDAEDTGSKLKLQDAIEAAQRTDTVVHILLVPADRDTQRAPKKLTAETSGRTSTVLN